MELSEKQVLTRGLIINVLSGNHHVLITQEEKNFVYEALRDLNLCYRENDEEFPEDKFTEIEKENKYCYYIPCFEDSLDDCEGEPITITTRI